MLLQDLITLSFYTKVIPSFIPSTKEPNLKDAWLSGFTDAEGCFSVKIASEKGLFYVSVLYILDQKNAAEVLDKIGLLFSENNKAKLRTPNIKHYLESNNNTIKPCNNIYRLTLYCNDLKKNTSYKILNYFNTYKLKTTKKILFISEVKY